MQQVDILADVEPVGHDAFLFAVYCRVAGIGRPVGGNVVFMMMQEAGDLAPQFGGAQRLAERPGGVEQLALKLLRDRVPLHDDGGAETSQDMLLDLGAPFALLGLLAGVSALPDVLRPDDLAPGCSPASPGSSPDRQEALLPAA